MTICHLLITRFNIQYEPADTIGIQPDWLEERLCLFEQYCLPSVQKQTCQNFHWILMGDNRTPKTYQLKLEQFASLIPQLRIYWYPWQQDGYHAVYKSIAEKYAKDCDALITSRLDSDDGLSADYIARVQEIAQSGIEGIISFPVGRQTFVRDNRSYTVRYVPNHFTSRIEHSCYETVMAYNHALLTDSQFHVINTEEPMWEEIVHGGNVSNDYVPKYRYLIRSGDDFCDLSCRWMRFQARRLIRFLQTCLVRPDER